MLWAQSNYPYCFIVVTKSLLVCLFLPVSTTYLQIKKCFRELSCIRIIVQNHYSLYVLAVLQTLRLSDLCLLHPIMVHLLRRWKRNTTNNCCPHVHHNNFPIIFLKCTTLISQHLPNNRVESLCSSLVHYYKLDVSVNVCGPAIDEIH